MSLPKDNEQDPRADALLTSALNAADGVEASGCPDAEVIGLYAERALAGAELRAVEAHLHTCPRCQATVAAFVRALPDETAEAAGAVSGLGKASAGGGFAAWFAGWRWLVPAASLTAVGLVAVWVGRGPAEQVAESARGAAALVETDTAAPATDAALERPPAAFVPQSEAAGARASRSAGAAGLVTEDARAKSAAPVEARKQAAAPADSAATANAAPPGTTTVGTSAETAREAAPAAAQVQETLTVTQAPPPPAAPAIAPAASAAVGASAAARARTTTFSALASTPWRVVDGRVERSRDDGATWERVATPDGIRVIAAGSPGGDICWLVADDGVLRTTNGRTWTRTTRPTSEPLAGVAPTSADRASVFTTSGSRWETTDGGRTWAPAP